MTTTTSKHPDAMPALTNRTIAEARRELRAKYPDLIVALHGDDTAPVRSQIPLPGQPILDRRQVALSDLEWREEVDVPDLVEIDPPTVANVYVACGARGLDALLVDGDGVRRPRDSDWSRCVARYADAPRKLARGAAVRLVLADTAISTMPNLVGRTIASAKQVLHRRFPGLQVAARGADDQIVRAQLPLPYAELRRGTKTLVLSVEGDLLVPDLRGMPVFLAEMECLMMGLNLAICTGTTQPLASCEMPPSAAVQALAIDKHHPTTPPASTISPGGIVGVIVVQPLKTLSLLSLAIGVVVGFALGWLVFYLL